VRVVPNLYPAFERQEVVIHSPDHVRSFAELEDGRVRLVAEAWQQRIGGDSNRVLALVNEGRLAGASLAHSHSQLVWTDIPEEPSDRLASLLEPHPVLHRGEIVAAVHPFGGAPYESLIAPRAADGDLADGLLLLRDLIRRLRELEGTRPWNAWLHPGPPWHLHVVPRLTALAGIELGAGIYVNVMPPERAAMRLLATS
jgi:UDPglucose--hexose-1-phosphate uridylyltransferase